MPLIPSFLRPLNYPRPPVSSGVNNLMFPDDLISSDRDIYLQMSFKEYSSGPLLGFGKYGDGGTDVMYLPMPKKLNDVPTVTWQAVDAVSMASQISSAANFFSQLITAAGPLSGITPNPFLWMLFKHPNFKRHSLSWTFTPNNSRESDTLRKIIYNIKFHMSPTNQGAYYRYPSVVIIRLKSKDDYLYKFKPCVIEAVDVDHTGAGMPSFFKGTNAPTVTNLTINLIELDLWTKNNIKDYG